MTLPGDTEKNCLPCLGGLSQNRLQLCIITALLNKISWYNISVGMTYGVYPSINKVRIGDPAYFKCIYNGRVKWKFENRDIDSSLVYDAHILLFTQVQLKHYGTYNCYTYHKSRWLLLQKGQMIVVGKSDCCINNVLFFYASKLTSCIVFV